MKPGPVGAVTYLIEVATDEAFTNNNIYAASATSIAIAAGIFVLSYSLLRLSNRHIFEGR